MEDAALYTDYLYVLNKGTIHMEGEPRDVFREPDAIREVGLELPEITRFIMQFNNSLIEKQMDISPLPLDIFDPETLVREMEKRLSKKRREKE